MTIKKTQIFDELVSWLREDPLVRRAEIRWDARNKDVTVTLVLKDEPRHQTVSYGDNVPDAMLRVILLYRKVVEALKDRNPIYARLAALKGTSL